jgi:hypothetical protein
MHSGFGVWIAMLSMNVLATITGLCMAVAPTKKNWLLFSQLVAKDYRYKPCPVCGSAVAMMIGYPGGGHQPIQCSPSCIQCKTEFRPSKFWYRKGFDVIRKGERS